MRLSPHNKAAVAVFSGIGLIATLTGCSADSPEPTPSTESTPGESTPNESASKNKYIDNTYTASGQYQSPGGTETIDVTVTLEDDVVTDVVVVGKGGNPNAERFQGEFAAGIAELIEGRTIDSISVSKVAGSSLTSAGFTAALEQIKADAAS